MSSKKFKSNVNKHKMLTTNGMEVELNSKHYININNDNNNCNNNNNINYNNNNNDIKNEKSKYELSDKTNAIELNYSAKLFLRCHCKQNDPFDNSTAIWCASFQPKTNESDGNRYVATCGANMVCIIDCDSIESNGKTVIARYIDEHNDEEFVCLSWNVVSLDCSSETLILAVGGKHSILLLSNYNEYHCYEKRDDAHNDQINALLFCQKDLLFSASYDRMIKLWKISLPNDNKTTILLKTIDSRDYLLSLTYSLRYDVLIASGIKGLFFWSNASNLEQNSVFGKIQTKFLVDGLHIIPEDSEAIAVRIHLSKQITIIDLKKTMDEMNKSVNKSEIKSISLTKVIKAKLESFESEYPYIYLSAQRNLLASGGPNGQIWLYNINRFPEYYRNQNTIAKPDRVIDWPSVENIKRDNKMIIDDKKPVIVNTVAISPNLKYIIGCTQINLLCIWQKT